ncbi:MAG: hypothetical protein K2I29_01410, partial [Clostridia bacterium]|nr:hypothetical protein [Clostridia bacterium]
MNKKINAKTVSLITLFAVLLCAVFAAFAVKTEVGKTAYASPTEELQTEVSAQSEEVSAQNAESLAAAWNAAVQESLDGNGKQVTFTLTENWTAQPDENGFGSGIGFNHNGALLVSAGANIVLDLGTYTLDRNLAEEETFTSSCITVENSTLEIKGTTGKITGANMGGLGVTGLNGDKAKLTISGGNITGNKSLSRNSGGGGLSVSYGAEIIMNGGEISDNSTTAYGGAAYIHQADFTMNGGKISENKASLHAGGLFVLGGSTLTLNDGEIISNNCPNYGGGVHIYAGNCQMTMNGGTISGNSAPFGGGVVNNGFFEMNNGEISDNNATRGDGGGVHNGGTFELNGGNISDNTATRYGGGIAVVGNSTATINDGTISGNTAGSGGGGVYVGATFVMTGGTISSNTAESMGAGIFVASHSTFELNGGTISDNEAQDSGGGVFIDRETIFTMNGGTISGNTAKNLGGGLRVFESTFIMLDGIISGNTAGNGGGVYASNYTKITGGLITKNSATGGGGFTIGVGSTLEMTGGTISGNTATGNDSAGIYFAGNSTFNVSGSPQIYENKRGEAEHNVYLSNNKITVSGLLSNAKIGVTMSTAGTFTTGYSNYLNGIAPSMFFFADNGKEIILSNNEAAIGTNAAPAAPTKSLIWQYRVKDGAWTTAPESIVYTGSSYEVQAVYIEGSTTTAQTIAKKTYHDANGNTLSTIKNAGTYAFLVNSTEYKNASFVLHIKPVEITVEWDDSKIYYSGIMQIPTHTLKGVLDSDKNYVKAVLDTSRAGTNAGNNYSVSIAELSGTYAVNYKFATGAKTTHNYSILKAQTVNPVVNFTGTLYASSKLPAISLSTGDTAGTIEWVTTSLKAGENVCEWKFTPASTDYTEQTGTYILYAEAIKPESIKATFNAGANTIYTTTTFEQLKSYIKLIAVNNDGSETEITDGSYTLYGELTEGTSNLSISYSGLATTVEIPNVQGGAKVTLSSLTAELTGTAKTDYTAFDKFNPAGVKVVATYSDGTTKQIADFTVAYADITKDYLCYGDTYITIRYTDGEGTASYRLNGLNVVKAKPTVTPDISLSDRLIAGERLPKIALTDGDTDGNILWKETTLTEGTK